MIKKTKISGFTLVELVIGSALMVVLLSGVMLTLTALTRGNVAMENQDLADQAIQTVYNQIQYEAAKNFSDMTRPDSLIKDGSTVTLQNSHNQNSEKVGWEKMKVFGSISEIDPANRTRTVELRAVWNEMGRTKEKIRTFSLIETRLRSLGATILIRFVDRQTGLPVNGIYASAPQQDVTDPTPCISGDDVIVGVGGVCRLENVFIDDVNGVEITIDAERNSRYFFDRGYPQNSHLSDGFKSLKSVANYSFLRYIQSPPTEKGEIYQLMLPIELDPPGKIDGSVVDVESSQGINDLIVRLHYKDLYINRTLGTQETHAETLNISGTNGSFQFNNLIPGNYYLTVIGNDTHASHGFPDDYPKANRELAYAPYYFQVRSGQSSSKLLMTARRGSVEGEVRGVEYDGTNYRVTSNRPTNVRLCYDRVTNNTKFYRTAGSQELNFEFKNSIAWEEKERRLPTTLCDNINSGDFLFPNMGPAIVERSLVSPAVDNSGFVHPLNQQYSVVTKKLRGGIVSPFLPIIVTNPTNSGLRKFLYVFNDESSFASQIAGALNPLSGFEKKIYANSTVVQDDFYLLERNALANIQGQILYQNDDGSPLVPFNYTNVINSYSGGTSNIRPLDLSVVLTAPIGNGGFGGIDIDSNGKATLNPHYSVASNHSSNPHTYSMSPNVTGSPTANNPYRLPPNLNPMEKTKLFYAAKSEPVNAHRAIHDGKAHIFEKFSTEPKYRKTSVGSRAGYLPIKYWNDPNRKTNFDVQLTNLTGTDENKAYLSLNADFRAVWYGQLQETDGYHLNPGQNQTNANIIVNKVPLDELFQADLLYIEVQDNDNFVSQEDLYTVHPTPGTRAKFDIQFKLWKKLETGYIYGRVLRPDGAPLVGATVELSLSDKDGYRAVTTTTVNDVCTTNTSLPSSICNGDYQYIFSNEKFIGKDEKNLRIKVHFQSPFNEMNYIAEDGYQGINWEVPDIIPTYPINYDPITGINT